MRKLSGSLFRGRSARGEDRRSRKRRVARGPAGSCVAQWDADRARTGPGMADSEMPKAWLCGRAYSENHNRRPENGKNGKSKVDKRRNGVLSSDVPGEQQAVPVQQISG